MTNETLASSAVAPQPRSLRRRLLMAVLLVVVLIPPVYMVGFFSRVVLSESTFGAVGTAFARWRYQDRFERQFAELTSCLEQILASASGDDAVAVAETCLAASELRNEPPLVLHVLAPVDDEPRWQAVRYVDSSYGLDELQAQPWSDGLHLISVPCVGRCLLYVHPLPEPDDPTPTTQAYSIVVPLYAIR